MGNGNSYLAEAWGKADDKWALSVIIAGVIVYFVHKFTRYSLAFRWWVYLFLFAVCAGISYQVQLKIRRIARARKK